MKALFREVEISTDVRQQLVDVTEHVERIVRDSGIENGIFLIHSLHSTTGIIINEHESGLVDDILRKITTDYPRGAGWRHDRIDDNADAHLASVFTGSSKTLPVRMGKLVRGTWQNIFLLELDGPRTGRRIVIEVLGE
jgi:secondary thiamine-phosphate synthase enzyme